MRNRVQLTDARAAKVAPTRGDAQPELWDQNCRGLYVRGGVRGNVLIFEKMIRGSRWREQLGPVAELTVADARQKALELTKAWDAQTEHRSRIPTLKDAAVRYAVERGLKHRNGSQSHEYSLTKYAPGLLATPLNRIKEHDVLALWDALAGTPGSRRMVVKHLREIFGLYGKRYRIASPLAVLPAIGASPKRQLIPEWLGPQGLRNWAEYLRQVRGYPGQDVAVLWELIALTGARANEWNSVQWADLDLDSAIVTFRDHKNAKRTGPRIFPITQHCTALLRLHRDHTPGDYLFPSRQGSKKPYLADSPCRALMKSVKTKVGYDTSVDMLRKVYITQAEVVGLTTAQIDYLVGQSVAGVRSHYSYKAADDMRPAMERISEHLLTAVNGTGVASV